MPQTVAFTPDGAAVLSITAAQHKAIKIALDRALHLLLLAREHTENQSEHETGLYYLLGVVEGDIDTVYSTLKSAEGASEQGGAR